MKYSIITTSQTVKYHKPIYEKDSLPPGNLVPGIIPKSNRTGKDYSKAK
jgi:hypothetical protein